MIFGITHQQQEISWSYLEKTENNQLSVRSYFVKCKFTLEGNKTLEN